MCRAEGMGISPWGSLGAGKFTTELQRQQSQKCKGEFPDDETRASRALEAVAGRKGTCLGTIALAYVMHKAPYVFPVVGCRKVEYLRQNIEALAVQLSDEDIGEIEREVPLDWGFPHNLLWADGPGDSCQDVRLLRTGGHFDHVKDTKVSLVAARPAHKMLTNQPIIPQHRGEWTTHLKSYVWRWLPEWFRPRDWGHKTRHQHEVREGHFW